MLTVVCRAALRVDGAFKVRDGINRAHSHNIIYGKPADYQCDGFNSTSMEYNTIIGVNNAAVTYGCVGKAFGAKGSYNSVKQVRISDCAQSNLHTNLKSGPSRARC